MSIFKNVLLILLLIIMGLVILGSAFLPIILSIVTDNWLWMFLYSVMWSAIWIEILTFAAILGIISEISDI